MRAWILATSLLAACIAPSFAADRSPACEAKRADIEAKLSQAQTQGRKQEAAGLQKALKANKANCTDKWLAQQRDKQIKQARKEVDKRESDLRKAEQKGDAQKIASRKAKLEEARAELAQAQKPLTP